MHRLGRSTARTIPGPVGFYTHATLDGSISAPWLQSISSFGAGAVTDGVIDWSSVPGGVRFHNPAEAVTDDVPHQLISFFVSNGYHSGELTTTWYRAQGRLPSGFVATAGNFNWLMEWHNVSSTVPGTVSMALGIDSGGAIPGHGTNPRLFFRTAGGPHTVPEYHYWYLGSNTLAIDHWYDFVFSITFGTTTSDGRASFWLDSLPYLGVGSAAEGNWANPVSYPTLFYNSSTLTRDQPGFGVYCYHYNIDLAYNVDWRDIYIGPTAASIGFTPT